MKTKQLCDRCKREFECDEDDLISYSGEPVKEIICQQCKDDATWSNLD
jgi:hypothetical protein